MSDRDLVVSVRLKADGSGLVGQARASATAVKELGSATATAGAEAQRLGAGTSGASAGARELAGSAVQAERAVAAMAGSTRQAAAAADVLATRNTAHTRAVNDNVRSLGRQQTGMRMVGQQAQDIGIQLSMGTSFIKTMAFQGGQLAYALEEAGVKGGGLVKFFAGPWGAAVLLGAALLEPLIGKLLESGDAVAQLEDDLAAAAKAADSFGNAQSLIGKVIDLATGKLKTHNAVLVQTIRLQAQAGLLAARQEQKDATEALKDFASPTLGESLWDSIASAAGADQGSRADAVAAMADRTRRSLGPLRSVLDDYSAIVNKPGLNLSDPATVEQLNTALDAAIGKVDTLQKSGQLAERDPIRAKQKILALATTLNDQIANQEALDALDGKGVAADLKPYSTQRKPKKSRSTASTEEFGRDAADKIASITARFDETPAAVRQAEEAVRQLDDLIDDLSRKKPPNFGTLIDQAEQAKTVVQQGLTRPFRDFVGAQQESFDILELQLAGLDDEARARQAILALEEKGPKLTAEQRQAVLSTVQALKAEERQLDIIHDKQRRQLNAIGQVRGEITDTIYGGVDALKDLPGRIFETFKRYSADYLEQNIFGGVFQKLEDQVTGTHIVEDASARMSNAVDAASRSIVELGNAAATAAGAVKGAADLPPADGGHIEVTAQRDRPSLTQPDDLFAGILGAVSGGIGLNEKTASLIGKTAGKGLRGAFEGEAAAGILNLVGIRTSGTGAALGGGLGGILGSIPGIASALGPVGAVLGPVLGIAGGLLGGLFGGPSKEASSSLSIDTYGHATAGAPTGRGSAELQAASALGHDVANSLNQIVATLGGQLSGAANVSIGYRPGHKAPAYRVDPTGRGRVAADDVLAFASEEEAVAYAVLDAIKDGAVTGLSSAVQKALRSSDDVEQAVREAVKVQELESLLGGVTGQLDKLFGDFERQARDRVELARKYGLDLLEVERVNAEQRADLLDQTLQSRVGDLRALLDDVKYGDLFEGSAADRRSAILKEIEDAREDARAGVEGAAGRLADLERQLVETSREAFGTAGPEYAADRGTAIADAEEIIKIETDRIKAAADAQKVQTDALIEGNKLRDEGNDLLAGMNARLDRLIAIGRIPGPADVSADLTLTARQSR